MRTLRIGKLKINVSRGKRSRWFISWGLVIFGKTAIAVYWGDPWERIGR